MFGMMKAYYEQITFKIPSWQLTLLTTAYLLLMFNSNFFNTVYGLNGAKGLEGVIFIFCLFLVLWAILNLCLSFVAFPWALKPAVIVLLVASSAASYFMDAYNIHIDNAMVQNIMETDVHEGAELLSIKLFLFVLITGIAPALLVSRATIDYGSPYQFIITKGAIGLSTVLFVGCLGLAFYQDYASLFRNNRYVRDLIVPVNYIHALNSYSKQFYPKNSHDFQVLGLDSTLGKTWEHTPNQKVVTVLIVGETARSANFSILGYPRETNPELSQKDIFNFNHVSSCGTSTAVSLPCMFSRLDREHYDEAIAKNSDNILDVLQRAGLHVVWIDNNSGCKNVCTRIDNEEIYVEDNPDLCSQDECFDMIFLEKIDRVIEDSKQDNIVIVLHQKGSHGPAYHLRTPKEYQQFEPFCHTNQLQECSLKEITNAYDNTILYTDHVVASVINYLESKSDAFESSMLYISDHGESLGENNLYLHGLPYFIAPDEQTHIPMLFWMEDNFANRFGLNKKCLHNKTNDTLSHDNLFDSLLGLLDIHTNIYQDSNNLFSTCTIHKS